LPQLSRTSPPSRPPTWPSPTSARYPSASVTWRLVLRDLAREATGRGAIIAAIAIGTVLSYLLADPSLATASAVAFAVAETMDFVVYEPLRRRGLLVAILASNAVGLLVDSLLFLHLAFGSLNYLPGQILGKTWMTLAAVIVLALLRRRYRVIA
jgi:hypothetical protein